MFEVLFWCSDSSSESGSDSDSHWDSNSGSDSGSGSDSFSDSDIHCKTPGVIYFSNSASGSDSDSDLALSSSGFGLGFGFGFRFSLESNSVSHLYSGSDSVSHLYSGSDSAPGSDSDSRFHYKTTVISFSCFQVCLKVHFVGSGAFHMGFEKWLVVVLVVTVFN